MGLLKLQLRLAESHALLRQLRAFRLAQVRDRHSSLISTIE